MADVSINSLPQAQVINSDDKFVLQQESRAMCLPGALLTEWLVGQIEAHGGITNITGPVRDDLEDTYVIHMVDSQEYTFTVTNGRGITDISVLSHDGLVDTYRILYNDDTFTDFTVANGNGISRIVHDEAVSTPFLDKYIIFYGDDSTFDYYVKNGKEVADVILDQSYHDNENPLKLRYRILYNDQTEDEFFVTNGAKGDKGDPGDNPEAQPVVAYGESDSISTYPELWSDTIPIVSPSHFLWTKIIVNFSTGGNPLEYYSVARMGVDGQGAVTTVNGVGVDSNGNVDLAYVSGTTLVIRRAGNV